MIVVMLPILVFIGVIIGIPALMYWRWVSRGRPGSSEMGPR